MVADVVINKESWLLFQQFPGVVLPWLNEAPISQFSFGMSWLAAAVTGHYAMSMNAGRRVGTLDMAKYFAQTMPGPHLWDMLSARHGRCKYDCLAHMTQLDNNGLESFLVGDGSAIHLNAVLRKHGPVLLKLQATRNLSADGGVGGVGGVGDVSDVLWEEDGTPVMHSMVIVGSRVIGADEADIRFLAQCWLPRPQFMEVDCVYLRTCHAHATYIKDKTFVSWPFHQ